jgi:hypothetical protein
MEEAVLDLDVRKAEASKTEYYQQRNSKVVHVLSLFGHSFLCGRQLTKDYRNCSLLLVVESMNQQCGRRAGGRPKEVPSPRLEAAVKRARRAGQNVLPTLSQYIKAQCEQPHVHGMCHHVLTV